MDNVDGRDNSIKILDLEEILAIATAEPLKFVDPIPELEEVTTMNLEHVSEQVRMGSQMLIQEQNLLTFENRSESGVLVHMVSKALTPTDLNPNQTRLSISMGQLSHEFKEQTLHHNLSSGNSVNIKLVDPQGDEYSLVMGNWMKGKVHVLKSGWFNVVKNNNLAVNQIIELYYFQDGDIHFIYLRLP